MYATKQRGNNHNGNRVSSRFHRGEGGILRKVQSLDCVRLNQLEFKGGWTKPSSNPSYGHHHFDQREKASRFSRYTAGERYVIFYSLGPRRDDVGPGFKMVRTQMFVR